MFYLHRGGHISAINLWPINRNPHAKQVLNFLSLTRPTFEGKLLPSCGDRYSLGQAVQGAWLLADPSTFTPFILVSLNLFLVFAEPPCRSIERLGQGACPSRYPVVIWIMNYDHVSERWINLIGTCFWTRTRICRSAFGRWPTAFTRGKEGLLFVSSLHTCILRFLPLRQDRY